MHSLQGVGARTSPLHSHPREWRRGASSDGPLRRGRPLVRGGEGCRRGGRGGIGSRRPRGASSATRSSASPESPSYGPHDRQLSVALPPQPHSLKPPEPQTPRTPEPQTKRVLFNFGFERRQQECSEITRSFLYQNQILVKRSFWYKDFDFGKKVLILLKNSSPSEDLRTTTLTFPSLVPPQMASDKRRVGDCGH